MNNSKDSIDSPECPPILLASDNPRVAESICHALELVGFTVQLADGYQELEPLWRKYRQNVVLLEVSGPQSIDAAVDAALRLKSHDAQQFVGYLADPVLRISGLVGDAIFPRSMQLLPGALREYFCPETAS